VLLRGFGAAARDVACRVGEDSSERVGLKPRGARYRALVNSVTRVFLDAGGSAPLHPVAQQALDATFREGWAEPDRLHRESRRARLILDGARQAIAAVIGARTEEVFFAPSHVAALHNAVRGVARGRRRVGADVVTTSVDRAALLNAAEFAAARGNGRHLLAPVDGYGRVHVETMAAAIASPGVALAAIQHANGEVGTIQPVEQIYSAAHDATVPLLLDAGSSLGHLAQPDAWDLLTGNAADWGGPAGIAFLAVRAGVRWTPDWPTDKDEGGWFPGGVSVPLALAAAASLEAVVHERLESDAHRRTLVELIRETVPRTVPDVQVHGDPFDRLPHVVTFSCLYVDGEALLGELEKFGIAVGSGSACTSESGKPSHVLAAMGALTHGNVRVVLPRDTTTAGVERFLAVLPLAVQRVRNQIGAAGL
jgi:cysteine desulfurase